MKQKKRIISFIIVFVLVLNYAPSVNAAKGEMLTINEDISDAIPDLALGGDD
ncbi:MAG: hypothetical protein PUC65_05355 [Clostridiales bacterium]|nr:hypothetical protein [Clostridiales bacterium]